LTGGSFLKEFHSSKNEDEYYRKTFKQMTAEAEKWMSLENILYKITMMDKAIKMMYTKE